MPHLPLEDPSDQRSLVEQSVDYVRSNRLLRMTLAVTALDHVVAIGLVVAGRLAGDIAGALALMSVLSWFFAVCMPVMTREVRAQFGARRSHYWGELTAMFARVLLGAVTLVYTAALVGAIMFA